MEKEVKEEIGSSRFNGLQPVKKAPRVTLTNKLRNIRTKLCSIGITKPVCISIIIAKDTG